MTNLTSLTLIDIALIAASCVCAINDNDWWAAVFAAAMLVITFASDVERLKVERIK